MRFLKIHNWLVFQAKKVSPAAHAERKKPCIELRHHLEDVTPPVRYFDHTLLQFHLVHQPNQEL